jgi:hypothetical protein
MEDNLIAETDNKKRFVLRKPIRILTLFLLYAVIMAEAMVVNTFNSSNASIRAALRITEKTHAMFTFIYHVGQFLSAICIILVMRRPQRKGTVLYSVFTTFAAVMFFQFTDNQMIIMTIYFFTGFCVMVMNVYIALWIDQLAVFSFKTIFLALTNLYRAAGVSCGILLNYYFGSDNFKKSFLIEGIILGCIGLAITRINGIYFSSDLLLYKGKVREVRYNKPAKTVQEEDTQSIEDKESVYRYRHSGLSTKDDYIIVLIYSFSKNKRYVCGMISAVILASVTGGFGNYSMGYINSYFTAENGGEVQKLKNRLLFTLIGPITAFFVIIIISFFVGNYYSKSTPFIMFICYLFTTISGNFIPCLKTPRDLTIAVLSYSIFSSIMGPFVQGTNLSAGTPSKKPFGVTINTIAGILLGQIPAPYIYNSLLKSFPKEDVLNIFMKFLIVGCVFNFLMLFFRLKEYPPEPEKKPEPAIELSNQQ